MILVHFVILFIKISIAVTGTNYINISCTLKYCLYSRGSPLMNILLIMEYFS